MAKSAAMHLEVGRLPGHLLSTPKTCYFSAKERDAAAGTRAYILKRDLSNAAVHVLTLTLPDWALARGCLLEVNITLDGIPTPTAQPCRQGDSAPWRAAPTMALPEGSTGAWLTLARHPTCQLSNTDQMLWTQGAPLFECGEYARLQPAAKILCSCMPTSLTLSPPAK